MKIYLLLFIVIYSFSSAAINRMDFFLIFSHGYSLVDRFDYFPGLRVCSRLCSVEAKAPWLYPQPERWNSDFSRVDPNSFDIYRECLLR